MQPVVKIQPAAIGPFPVIERGSLICSAKSGANPRVLLVLEIITSIRAKCMVMHPGDSNYSYGYTAIWDIDQHVVWRGTLTLTQ